jgi:chaperone BCS1
MSICVLNLSERGLTDDRLALALSTIPAHSIVLLEDIDAAFPSRLTPGSSSEVTFSGLLNVLDGVSASEDRLVFMTTNHIERLDPALIRPGRVDYVQLVGDATDFQTGQLFAKFYPDSTPEQRDTFVQTLRQVTNTISMAALQGYLLRHKSSAEDASAQLPSILQHVLTNSNVKPVDDTAHHSLSKGEPRPVRPLTAEEVDRMVFNPQPGWDKGL